LVKAITIINIANGVLVENEQGTLSVKRRLQRIIPSSCWLGIVGLHSSQSHIAVGFISKSVIGAPLVAKAPRGLQPLDVTTYLTLERVFYSFT